LLAPLLYFRPLDFLLARFVVAMVDLRKKACRYAARSVQQASQWGG
jgi:hypothetical protein